MDQEARRRFLSSGSFVNDNPYPYKVHGKVGFNYFYIANLDGVPLASAIKWQAPHPFQWNLMHLAVDSWSSILCLAFLFVNPSFIVYMLICLHIS